MKFILYLYIILWVFEGALRKWVFPGLSTPLLLVRDPLVIIIYFIAIRKKIFPSNGFITSFCIISFLGFMSAMIFGHNDLATSVFGVRTFLLHFPLVFLFPKILDRNDLLCLGKWALFISLPMTMLLIAQYKSPPTDWVNRGVGGEGTAVFSGALDKHRPPGTFSFISGPVLLYPLITAFWFLLYVSSRAPWWLILLSGISIFMACPVSISRSLVISVSLVSLTGVIALVRTGILAPGRIILLCFGLFLIVGSATRHPEFAAASEAFSSRWDESTTQRGGFDEAILGRMINGITGPLSNFMDVPVAGHGIGLGTQVGAKLTTGEKSFEMGESEFTRVFNELGPLLGLALIITKFFLVLHLSKRSYTELLVGNYAPLIFLFAAIPSILIGQWGQTTSLGAFVITTGIVLVAMDWSHGVSLSHQRRKAVLN